MKKQIKYCRIDRLCGESSVFCLCHMILLALPWNSFVEWLTWSMHGNLCQGMISNYLDMINSYIDIFERSYPNMETCISVFRCNFISRKDSYHLVLICQAILPCSLPHTIANTSSLEGDSTTPPTPHTPQLPMQTQLCLQWYTLLSMQNMKTRTRRWYTTSSPHFCCGPTWFSK